MPCESVASDQMVSRVPMHPLPKSHNVRGCFSPAEVDQSCLPQELLLVLQGQLQGHINDPAISRDSFIPRSYTCNCTPNAD